MGVEGQDVAEKIPLLTLGQCTSPCIQLESNGEPAALF